MAPSNVQALYTNIPTQGQFGGLVPFEKALESRSDKTVPAWYLLALLQQILDNNIFEFNGELWRQSLGTAMGTRVAPTYACLFISDLEQQILDTWHGTKPLLFKRYIDDLFFAWPGSAQELEEFLAHMNSVHPTIKFTSSYDTETRTIPFLDMLITLENGKFSTDLYKKDTAKCQYLLPSSCHAVHQTTGIIYSLAYRLKRICSDNAKFEHQLSELKQDLLSRQYNGRIIDKEFDKVRKITRQEALKKVIKEENEREALVVTYHPSLPSVSSVLKKHWEVMTENPNLKRCFPSKSLVAYRRNKNLKEHLVRARVSS